MPQKVNLKLLSAFMAVAEHGSFRKAAEQTFVSLPAISMQIKQLETQLGVALFQRTTRHVELTREGEDLLITARKAMAELDTGLARIQQAANVQHGTLAFACVPTVAGSRLPAVLTEYARHYPGISVRVRELSHHDLLEAVRRREVDFGIGPVEERRGELEFRPIFNDEYCALLPRGYRDNGRKTISLRELTRLRLLTLAPNSLFRNHLEDALRANNISADLSYEFTHASTLIAMVEAGLGAGILPRIAVPRGTSLATVRIARPALQRTIAVVTIRGYTLPPTGARLVEMLERSM
ncbi:LysR family transcriptional regulator [Bordetella petrii]|uniref:LysR family transcriptional regulator n=1 Tax=Bordetella petrii TaxID=94624 RepID=UPI001E549E0E|nr:LysR family transcriptional regulator [Bordetella petrii]MCD0502500.1 LysR substrate-binding domain-containing protein [Bordetella petrii]